jgi:hypothetical protein
MGAGPFAKGCLRGFLILFLGLFVLAGLVLGVCFIAFRK